MIGVTPLQIATDVKHHATQQQIKDKLIVNTK